MTTAVWAVLLTFVSLIQLWCEHDSQLQQPSFPRQRKIQTDWGSALKYWTNSVGGRADRGCWSDHSLITFRTAILHSVWYYDWQGWRSSLDGFGKGQEVLPVWITATVTALLIKVSLMAFYGHWQGWGVVRSEWGQTWLSLWSCEQQLQVEQVNVSDVFTDPGRQTTVVQLQQDGQPPRTKVVLL